MTISEERKMLVNAFTMILLEVESDLRPAILAKLVRDSSKGMAEALPNISVGQLRGLFEGIQPEVMAAVGRAQASGGGTA